MIGNILNWIIKIKLQMKDTIVPDHVLLGLTLGIIGGPLIILPAMYAIVSLKKAVKITKYKIFLS